MLDTFTVGDQQRLSDGESVIGGRGLGTFITYTPATYERRRLHHRIRKEISKVTATANAARVEVLDEYNYRGLTEFAVFHSYLSTAHKWGKQTRSTHRAVPHRPMATPSTHTQLNSYVGSGLIRVP